MTRTNRPDIFLKTRSGGWVEVINNGGKSYPATTQFLIKHNRFMSRVCFGTEHVPNFGTLCIELHRVPAFIAYAERCGFWAEPMVEVGA